MYEVSKLKAIIQIMFRCKDNASRTVAMKTNYENQNSSKHGWQTPWIYVTKLMYLDKCVLRVANGILCHLKHRHLTFNVCGGANPFSNVFS